MKNDYAQLPRDIAECMYNGGAPLSEDQYMMLVGYLAQWQSHGDAARSDQADAAIYLAQRAVIRDGSGKCFFQQIREDAERLRLGELKVDLDSDYPRAQPETIPKCDGNHAWPPCRDGECWHDGRPTVERATPQPDTVEAVAIVEHSDYQTAAAMTGNAPKKIALRELHEGALKVGDKLCIHPPAQPNTVPMPRRLTAENGAKAALIGEFHEHIRLPCPECEGDDADECDFCEGSGDYEQLIPVTWTTIKEIYSRAVALFHGEGHAFTPEPAKRDTVAVDEEAEFEHYFSLYHAKEGQTVDLSKKGAMREGWTARALLDQEKPE